jgi:GWxTD domain-containing protein
VKSSSTCCAGSSRALLCAAALLAAACGASAPPARQDLAELTNPFLGPEYSQWLVGAVARLATPAESDAYLALRDDAAAAAFIADFWVRRDPNPAVPGNPVLETFEKRAADADRVYSEAGVAGRRTARGTTHILYGAPTKVDFEVSPTPEDPPIELWRYDEGAPAGLDARRPARFYRFIRRGDLTIFYTPRDQDRRLSRDPSRTPPFRP